MYFDPSDSMLYADNSLMPEETSWLSSSWSRRLDDTNTTTTDDVTGSSESDSEKLRNMAIVYGSALAIVFLLFCHVRQKYPRAFAIRQWVEPLKTPLAEDSFGFFSWLWKLNFVTDDDMMNECGMDSLCFLHILYMGVKISLLGMLNAIWLFPLYATAKSTDETDEIQDVVVQLTIAHVGAQSPRLIGTVIAAYMLFGYSMYLILQEFEWFIDQRHRFLQRPRAENYSIFVRHVPQEVRSNLLLERFFSNSLGPDCRPEARVALTTPQLAKTVARRDVVVAALENAIAYEDIHKKRLTHSQSLVAVPGVVGGEKVDSITTYGAELKQLNEDIAAQIEAMERAMQAPPPVNNSVASKRKEEAQPNQDIEVGVDEVSAMSEHDNDEKGNFLTSGLSTGLTGLSKVGGALLAEKEDGEPMADAFVSFSTLAYATAALQMVHDATPFCMLVEAAPQPDDVFWNNVGRAHKDLQLGRLFSMAATTALCLLWTIPMTFFASLSSVSGLREEVDFLDKLLDNQPWLVPVFEQLAPLLVVVVNSLLPIILEYLSMFEGPVSSSVVEASLFSKLAAFMIIQTFFVSAVSGGIMEELANLIEDPTSAVALLATSLPAQSTYFIQIVFVGTVMMVGMEILRVIPLILAWVRTCIGPKLTEKQRQTTFMGIRPLADPLECAHADNFSQVVFYFMVLFVYQVIAPLTSFILWFVFLFCYVAYRHQFVYIYPTLPDSGGKMWTSFINLMIVCMIVAEITIVGLLALKEAASAVPLMLPLLIGTFLFRAYISQQHFRVAAFLPSRAALKTDVKKGDPDMVHNFVHRAYLQPELREKQAYPEGPRALELGFAPETQSVSAAVETGSLVGSSLAVN